MARSLCWLAYDELAMRHQCISLSLAGPGSAYETDQDQLIQEVEMAASCNASTCNESSLGLILADDDHGKGSHAAPLASAARADSSSAV